LTNSDGETKRENRSHGPEFKNETKEDSGSGEDNRSSFYLGGHKWECGHGLDILRSFSAERQNSMVHITLRMYGRRLGTREGKASSPWMRRFSSKGREKKKNVTCAEVTK